jgi:flagellar basal body rod protein FlgG
MAVIPVYLNGVYQQNNIIDVNGVRYMYMATRYGSGGYTNDGHFLVQIDGDMHTLKGIQV